MGLKFTRASMETQTKRGVIYFRVSTDEQARLGVSLEQQENCCQRYADTNGIKVIKSFHDDGVSAKTTKRDGLQDMLAFCCQKSNKIDCVIIYKIDRLTRNTGDYLSIGLILGKLGIELISTTEATGKTAIGRFMGTFLAANAQLDNEMKGERVSHSMKLRFEQGRWCWKAPIGYLNTQDALKRKMVVIDKKRAPLIKWAFEEFATGCHSVEDIRRKVNEKGLRNTFYKLDKKRGTRTFHSKEISPQTMSKILTNKFYAGTMVSKKYGEKENEDYEPLISKEIFYKCQKILGHSDRGDNISKRRPNKNFPLQHEIICAFCGKPMTASLSTGKCGGKFPYYHCYNQGCSKRKFLPKERVEEDYFNYLKEVTPKDHLLRTFKAVICDVWHEEYGRINQDRKEQLKNIESLKEEKERLIEMKKKELLPDDDFKESFAKLRKKIDEAEASLSETKMEEFNRDEAIGYVFNFIKDIPEYWKNATYEQKLKLQSLIFPEKPIYDHLKFQTPKLSPILQSKKDLANAKSLLVAPRRIELLLPH